MSVISSLSNLQCGDKISAWGKFRSLHFEEDRIDVQEITVSVNSSASFSFFLQQFNLR